MNGEDLYSILIKGSENMLCKWESLSQFTKDIYNNAADKVLKNKNDLRDDFAMLILAKMVDEKTSETSYEHRVKQAYKLADIALLIREKSLIKEADDDIRDT